MKILVIGASGYIGSHVAAALAGAGHSVAALRRPGGTPPPSRYLAVAGDLADPPSLTAAAAGFDGIVHAGGPLGDSADLAGADALIAAGSPVLYTTGAAVLGHGPQDEDSTPDPHPIAAVRPEIERRVRAAGGWVIRPGLVYGNGGGLVPGLFAAWAAERGVGVYIGPPGTRLPVVHVDDLAALYLAVVSRARPGTVWHGTAESVRLDAVAEILGGGRAVSWPVAAATAQLGPLADLLTRDQVVSSARTRAELGWQPVHTSMLADLAAASAAAGAADGGGSGS